ncbi:MarR family winged helix-turn-helix transcriptional regulator [uncultured Ferrovibrio sp.]|jgi:Transcriptional regulators|uniref:MarR family winged helix-turn-helix transcriptional regulator n=1 Tax=uncultured Ferrovibrio sp. TaxID=1576913 RepID=UPI0026307473|nr:MarR family winged helix-turn-helix transcriptional regulator [uncultured Ferrovibrio sp.]
MPRNAAPGAQPKAAQARAAQLKGASRRPAGLAAGKAGVASVDYGSLPNHVGYLLRLAQLRVWDDFYARLGDTGISPSLYSALILVERNPGLQQSRLGEALGVARSGAMTMVDRLERLGLVERRADPHDRRAYSLFLTREGRERMSSLIARVQAHDKIMNAVFTSEEHRMLMKLLHKFIAAPATRGNAGTDNPSAPGDSPISSRQKRPARSEARAGRRAILSREERP